MLEWIIGLKQNKTKEVTVKGLKSKSTNLTVYCRRTPTKLKTQWRVKAGEIGLTVETDWSMETVTAKIDDADVAHGCSEGTVDGMASSDLMMVTSSLMVSSEEIIGSKAENTKEPNRSGVGSGLVEKSPTLTS